MENSITIPFKEFEVKLSIINNFLTYQIPQSMNDKDLLEFKYSNLKLIKEFRNKNKSLINKTKQKKIFASLLEQCKTPVINSRVVNLAPNEVLAATLFSKLR